MLKKANSLCNVSNCNDVALSIKVQNFRSRYMQSPFTIIVQEHKRSIEIFTFTIKIKMSQKPSNTEKKVKTKGKKKNKK